MENFSKSVHQFFSYKLNNGTLVDKIFLITHMDSEAFPKESSYGLQLLKNSNQIVTFKKHYINPNLITDMDILSSEREEFNPYAIIIENLSGNFKNISKLKSYLQNYNNPIIHINLDAYHYPKKRLSKILTQLLPHCDFIYTKAGDGNLNYLKRYSSAKFYWIPHPTFSSSIVKSDKNTQNQRISMFGNLWTSRYSSLLNFTGVNERIALAKKANELFGNQFQLYGKNWDKVGLTSRECQLFEVSFEMQKYCLNIGWEHFYNYRYYFSDRPSISYSSRKIHISNPFIGLEKIIPFHDDITANNIEKIIEKSQLLIGKDSLREKIEEELYVFSQEYFSEKFFISYLIRRSIDEYY